VYNSINYDKIKESWYGVRLPNQVRSVDCLFVKGGVFYFIEFKTGKPDNLDIHRKIYDTVLGLVEHNILTLDACRTQVKYLVVSKRYGDAFDGSLLEYLETDIKEPWDYEINMEVLRNWDKNDIRKLSNFLVRKVYKLSLTDFDKFAENRGWRN
jgi:hypothetical protein